MRKRSGLASILALVFLALFTVLGLAYATMTNANLLSASNQSHVQGARMQAEGGLSYLIYLIGELPVPADANAQALMATVGARLASVLNGSQDLGGGSILSDANGVAIPSISTGVAGQDFSARLYAPDANSVRLLVCGRDGTVRRSVSLDFNLAAGGAGAFGYGIATNGPVSIIGNASVRGASDANEAKILTTIYNHPNDAYNLTGNANLQGDIYASDPAAIVSLTGNVSIGGGDLWHGDIYNHIHLGTGAVPFPEVDPTVFEPFATNIVDSHTSTNGNKTFSNIRILAGTNPTFSGNITLKGVVFVETPNRVTFTGNLNMTGVLVTQDAGDNHYTTNTVKFSGNTTVRGVETLPDIPEYHTLRGMPGSFLLAPGFGVEFVGNFGTVSGAMAAEKLSFTGNAGGTVKGSIITYSDQPFSLQGNSSVTIDRSRGYGVPPGFRVQPKLQINPDTYKEY